MGLQIRLRISIIFSFDIPWKKVIGQISDTAVGVYFPYLLVLVSSQCMAICTLQLVTKNGNMKGAKEININNFIYSQGKLINI